MSLPDRLSSIGTRDEPASDNSAGGLMQKCVIIQKDEKGYGFTVSGDNPVFVASVKQDGAAARAGVQNGDRIVKVNGTLVTQRNHVDVVRLIKSGSYVALTLLGKPSPSASSGVVPHSSSLPYFRESGIGRVTAPQPVDPDKDKELWQQKIHMTRAMYETAKEDFEKLQKQYVSKPSEKLHSLLLEKERTVKALENQLKQLTGGDEPVTASPLTTAATADVGNMSDSSQTSPSVSPTPDDSHSRHNGLDMGFLTGQNLIIPPEYEEDSSDEDLGSDPGPFADIKLLENKPAHMAVFLNYLISNSDPSPVLFHIISDLFSRSTGNNKELRKWAYEIFSTFIYKMAPLSITVDENIISQIDNILVSSGNRTDNENVLRAMFQAPRQFVQVEIADMLIDFRNRRDLGMGNLYGIQKIHDNMDKTAEIRVAEELLMPHFKCFWAEDNSQGVVLDKDLATGWALATFLRSLGGPKNANSTILERIQTFMMKDKRSIKFLGSRSGRAKVIKGHQFNLQHFYVTTFCNFCGNLIWGVGYQGYQCQNCEMILHKLCSEEITEVCGGKKKTRISARLPLSGVIQNRRLSSNNPGQQQQQQQQQANAATEQPAARGRSPPHTDVTTQPYPRDDDSELGTALSIIAGLSGGHSVQNMVSRFQGLNSPTSGSSLGIPAQQEVAESLAREAIDSSRRISANLNRTGSLNNKGKKSDRPARRAKSDVDVDSDTFKEINQSASSSASSLSNRSIESPGNSTDNVSELLRAQYDDPDLNVEPELPPLKQVLPEDVLRKLKPKEKKRQEVINEFFYTERAHLRNLKVLNMLFNIPMYQEKGYMAELARALFPNMDEMISLHEMFVKDIKERTQSTPVVQDVGDLLLKRFDGEAGERFRKGCAEYCRNQAFALDALKKQTRKEPKLQQFLHDAESNSLCRRLQLKDLVPSQMQRLTKYPLLIDSLLKYTNPQSEEHRKIERALERCKHILAYVNQAVRDCDNYHKLKDFQKKLDRRSLEGLNDPAIADLKNLDLSQHKLVFDSPLTWKLRSHRTVDLHVLLLEDLLVLLQKQDDKYVLKCQNTNVQSARDDKYTHFPVLKLQNLLARTLATEKKSFFVVNISESRAQMYEFTAASSELRLKWCKLINEKADEFKTMSKLPYMQSGDSSEMTAGRQKNRMPQNSPGHGEQTTSTPALDDIYQVTDQLSRRLDISEDQHSEGELIPPEEVQVSDAVSTKSSVVSSPQASLSPVVSSQQIQPPPQLQTQASLSTQEQLKNMAAEMNVILAKLAGAMNLKNEQKQELRRELQKAQQELESLKQKKQLIEATSPSGRSSPCVPLTTDIPLVSCTSNTETTATTTYATATEEQLQLEQEALAASSIPCQSLSPEQEANLLRQKYGLGVIPLSSSLAGDMGESSSGAEDLPVLLEIQDATVAQLEENMERVSLYEDSEAVPVIATETSEAETEDYYDTDSNEVSVADLPLPDPVSIRGDDIVTTQHRQEVDLDDSEADTDDNDTVISRRNFGDMVSLSAPFQDAITGEEEVQMVSDLDTEIVTSMVSSGGDADWTSLKDRDEMEASWTDVDETDVNKGDTDAV